jgi:rod shape-determining protein MreD
VEAIGLTMDHPAIRYVVIIGTAAFLQYTLFSQFRIAGVSADLFLVVAIAAGIVAGSERGAVIGFICGICLDLLIVTPFGLGAISGLAAGLVAGLLEGATIHSARWLTAAIAFISSGVGVLAFAVAGALLGRPDLLSLRVFTVMVVVGASSALLVFPAVRVCRWADPEVGRMRAAVR